MQTYFLRSATILASMIGSVVFSTVAFAQPIVVSPNPIVHPNVSVGDTIVIPISVTNQTVDQLDVKFVFPTLQHATFKEASTMKLDPRGGRPGTLTLTYTPKAPGASSGVLLAIAKGDTVRLPIDLEAKFLGPTFVSTPSVLHVPNAVYGQVRDVTLVFSDLARISRKVTIATPNKSRWTFSQSSFTLASQPVTITGKLRIDVKEPVTDTITATDGFSTWKIPVNITMMEKLMPMSLEYPWDVVRIGKPGETTPSQDTVVIKNTGEAPFSLEYAMQEGVNQDKFRIDGPQLPYKILPGEQATIVVKFAPTGSDSVPGAIWILGAFNDSIRYEGHIQLSGGTRGVVSSIDDIDAHAQNSVSCAPNPATNALTLSYSTQPPVDHLEIVQANGISVHKQSIKHELANGKIHVDVQKLPAGMYYALLRSGGKMIVTPFVKQ